MAEMKESEKKNIKNFAYEAFEDIWSKKTFLKPLLNKQLAESLGTRLSDKYNVKDHHFTEHIANAINLTQIFLHDYFKAFFDFNSHKNLECVFKNDFKFILLRWLKKRDHVFVKIIDTLAIIAEAFIYCDLYSDFTLHPTECIEWFIELFEDNFAADFFKKGGWSRLNERAISWYSELFEIVDDVVQGYSFDYKSDGHFCEVALRLRLSKVMFPVSEHWFCDKCRDSSDKKITRLILFVVVNNEVLKCIANKISDENTSESIKNPTDDTKGLADAVADPSEADKYSVVVAVRDSSDTIKDSSGTVKDSSDTVKDSSDTVKDSSDTVKDSSDTVKDSSDTVKDSSDTVKDSSDTVKDSSDALRKCVDYMKKDDVLKPSSEVDEESTDVAERYTNLEEESSVIGNIPGNKVALQKFDALQKAIDDLEELINIGTVSIIPKMKYSEDRKEYTERKLSDAGVESIDCENDLSDHGRDLCDTRKDVVQPNQKQVVKDKSNVKKEFNTVVTTDENIHQKYSSFTGLYLSDSTVDKNQRLLKKLVGNICQSERKEETDFFFLSKEYSYSVEVMLKEVFSIQPEDILQSDTDIKVSVELKDSVETGNGCKKFGLKTVDFLTLNNQLLSFNDPYICVCVGGKHNKSKSSKKKQKKI